MNDEEARKWLQLGFETYGLEGMLQVAAAMGVAPRRHRQPQYSGRLPQSDQILWPGESASRRRWPQVGGQDSPSLELAASRSDCIEKCYHLLERALPFPGSDKNTWDFHKCVNECMATG